MPPQTRRTVLTTAGSLGVLTIAGCLGDEQDTTEHSDDTIDDESDDQSPGDDIPEDDEDDDTAEEDEYTDELSHLPGEAIEDFEELDSWYAMIGQGELSATEDSVYAGAQSAWIEANEDTEYAGVYREFFDPLDLHDKNLSLAVRFTGREMFDLTVQVLAPNSRNYLQYRRVLTGPTDRWVRVDLGANLQRTQPDLYDVREIRVIGRRRRDTEGSISFAIDDLRAVERPENGAVILLFDGMYESQHDVALDILEEYDAAGVAAIIPEAVDGDGRLTLDQMRTMQDAGWDMISRPRVGARFMHEFTAEEQEGMIRRAQTYLRNRGFEDGAKHFFTPRNIISPEGMDLVREYHEQAFRYGGSPNALPLTDPHNLGHFSASNGDDARSFIDLATEYKQLAVPLIGDIDEDGMSEESFRDLLEYIDERDVEIITATDLLTEY